MKTNSHYFFYSNNVPCDTEEGLISLSEVKVKVYTLSLLSQSLLGVFLCNFAEQGLPCFSLFFSSVCGSFIMAVMLLPHILVILVSKFFPLTFVQTDWVIICN